ncbi:hypothetical protein BUALT_Bualt12G0067600 [Buddleja alternifolia]|uniref:Gustatory receptor n=1 Tax=Buddleja alternifolia TaxID=168488 RepID=A0AAV6WWH6_9LAMI|nr:hypothetical protein BUALT_Bualt12G0067600 [Buddleja alternifolia]
MEFYEMFNFLTILKESIKLLHKNGKLMASIAILSLLFTSIFFALFIFSIESLIYHMADISLMEPSYQDMLKYFAIFLAVQLAFIRAVFTIFHLSRVVTIIVATKSYNGDILSSQDLFSSIKRTWKRPLITIFYLSRQTRCYSLFLGVLVALALMYPNFITISITILFGIAAFVFYLYLAVVSFLSIVVSVVEDRSSGREAREKASEIVKGKRLHGFLLNLFFNLLVWISHSLLGYWMIIGDKGIVKRTICGLFMVNISSLVHMFVFMAYTVLYFQCKMHHGEEIAMHGKVHYTKLINDIP